MCLSRCRRSAQLTVNPLVGLPNRPFVIGRAVINANPFVVGSPAGRVAGEASTFPVFQGTPTNAGFWDTPNGVVLPNPVPGTVLGTLTGFNGSYSGQGISGSTRVAGYALQFGAGMIDRLDCGQHGQLRSTGVLPSALGTNERAYAINDNEQIVGYVLDGGDRPKALGWDPGMPPYGNATIWECCRTSFLTFPTDPTQDTAAFQQPPIDITAPLVTPEPFMRSPAVAATLCWCYSPW
jgi:hypothetical protein